MTESRAKNYFYDFLELVGNLKVRHPGVDH